MLPRSWRTVPPVLLVLSLLALSLSAATRPTTVYPGGAVRATIGEACPMFSWSQVPDATGYELVVYRAGANEEATELILQMSLPAGSAAWTPLVGSCLSAGAPYAWRIRAMTSEGVGEWSEPSIFEVAAPSRDDVAKALGVLRRYLDERSEVGELERAAVADMAKGSRSRVSPEPPVTSEPPMAAGVADRTAAISRLVSAKAEAGVLRAAGEEQRVAKAAMFAASLKVQSAAPAAIYGQTSFSDGIGVLGEHTSPTDDGAGVFGFSDSTRGTGVLGLALATNGATLGVFGETLSGTGTGVYGFAFPAGGGSVGDAGVGVVGETQFQFGSGVFGKGLNRGVSGLASSVNGEGVSGFATSPTGATVGVRGTANSPDGYGVIGSAQATQGSNVGVYGKARGDDGLGVWGLASSTGGSTNGVYGQTDSTQGRGVSGYASAATGSGVGIYGAATSATGYAGYFDGRVHVAGTLSKSAGSFKIDHPLDPANRYLSHSFVESPDMLNLYNGIVTLDAEGAAWVQMPNWFDALNRDVRYQLTAIGESAPSLYVARKIEHGRFRIAGGAPGMEVSWQITGVRDDPYARQHPIEIEEDKGELRGFYLNPDAYGLPPEQGVSWRHRDQRPVGALPSTSEGGSRVLHPPEGTDNVPASGGAAETPGGESHEAGPPRGSTGS